MFRSFHGKYKYRSRKYKPSVRCAEQKNKGEPMDLKYAMLFALLMVPLASAALSDAVKGQGLEAAMADVECRNAFTIGVMDSVASVVPDEGLEAQKAALEADKAKLQSYADSGDTGGFRSYVRGTYDQHLRDARQAILGWRKDNARSVTGAQHTSLRGAYAALRETYNACHLNALKSYGKAKAQAYGEALDRREEKLENLSAKGVDTHGLGALISQARSQVVSPLESAVDAASGILSYHNALKSYCLYDGCPEGRNFHFAAKWEAEKLRGILEVVKADPRSANYAAEIASAESGIATAESVVSAAGDSQFTAAQHDQLWNALSDASRKVKEILSGMRSG